MCVCVYVRFFLALERFCLLSAVYKKDNYNNSNNNRLIVSLTNSNLISVTVLPNIRVVSSASTLTCVL